MKIKLMLLSQSTYCSVMSQSRVWANVKVAGNIFQHFIMCQSLGRITQSENKSVHCCWLMLGKRPNHAKSLHCLTTIVETTSHFYQVFFLTPERVGIRRSKSTNYGLKFPASVQCVFRTKLGLFAQAIHSDISLVYREINQ